MKKKIIYNEEAKKALFEGISQVANAVRVTMGPKGRNVALAKTYGAPVVTNDGVSIAREIELQDPFQNMGAKIIKEVAEKTNDMAGDGTTSSVVLTHAIIEKGLKKLALGGNVMLFKAGMEEAVTDSVSALKAMAKPIKDNSEIKQIATISAESQELGEIIASTIEKVGNDGVVTVEESQTFGVTSDFVDGFEFDKGYVSHYMVTDQERMEAVYRDVPVLLTDKSLFSTKEILPLLEKLAQSGRKELVIIADEIEGDVLATFVVNKLRGVFNILAIKTPGFGVHKKEALQDMAVTLGATIVSEETGLKLETVELNVLGKAKKVISSKDKTVIIGSENKEEIAKRVAELKLEIPKVESKHDKARIESRIAKLSGGVAIIKVGAATETEMRYLKLKIEDAVNATKAAIEEGVVAGGGTTLVMISNSLKKDLDSGKKKISGDKLLGYLALVEALEAPFRQIVTNSGTEDVGNIISKVKDGSGYDALSEIVISDMVSAGIIDPVKVIRGGLENSSSAAGIFLTTEVAIADIPETENKTEGVRY